MSRDVKASVDATLLKIAEITAIVEDYKGEPGLLPQKLEEYLQSLRTLLDQRDKLLAQDGTPIEVAEDMIRYIDEGDNPDRFTDDVFRSSLIANQASKGKVQAIGKLRKALDAKLAEAFPEQCARYDELRSVK